MPRRTRKNSKRQINKIYINRKRNIAIVILIAICLFVIYKINFLTKSEETIKLTSVKFKEISTNNVLNEDLEIKEDEKGKYIVLPETVNGIYAQKYYVLNSEESDEKNLQEQEKNQKQDNTINETNETIENNEIIENIVSEIENKIENTSVQDTNTNEVTDSLFDRAVQANQKEFLASNDKPENSNEISETNIEKSDENTSYTNTTVDNNENENKEQNEVSQNNTISDNTITETPLEKNENNTKNEVSINNENTNTIEENANSDLLPKQENVEVSGTSYVPGEKIYFDEEILDKDLAEITVEYQTVEINDIKLYKQDLSAEDEFANIKVTGFAPLGYFLEINKEDNEKYQELKSDAEGISDSDVILAYDIKITNGTNYYQPKDYYQTVNVSIKAKEQTEIKFSESLVQVIHIVEDENKVLFEKLALESKSDDTVEVITDEFSTYIVTALSSSVGDDQVYIYDYESDKNYFTGKNYTDELTSETKKEFKDENLAEVIINYFGYNYVYQDRNKDDSGVFFTYVPRIMSKSNIKTIINGQDRYVSSYTINFTTDEKVVANNNWKLEFASNGTFNVNNTQNYQYDRNNVTYYQSDTINLVQEDNGIITIGNDTFSGWTETSSNGQYTYTTTIYLVYNDEPVDIDTFDLSIHKDLAIGHTSNTERQDLYTYDKCVYTENGKISIELIDNPYMDRPAGFGFNGWKTNEPTYNITTDSNTFVQTLTVSLNDIKDASGNYVINLYPDWKEANIIFLASNGNNNNSGTDIDNPVRDWSTAVSKLSANRKTATGASNRELNIIVLKNGTFTTSNCNIGNAGALTLTSLYDGNLYTNNAAFTVNSNVTLNNDLQIDYLKINTTYTYAYNAGTGNLNYCIYGNTYNLRIGRGIESNNNNYTTFTQVQLGPNGTNRGLYKSVIESGKYNNIQVGRASGNSSYTYCGIMVLGCDIDRISGNNTNLSSYYRTASRTSTDTVNGYKGEIKYLGNIIKPSNGISYLMITKSGNFGMQYFSNNNDTDRAYAGIYLGGHGSSGTDTGDRYLIVEGGEIANIIGGLQTRRGTVSKTCIYVKNGNVQNIVGGAGVSETYGDRVVQVSGGEIAYSISGGSNGYAATTSSIGNGGTTNNGRLDGKTYVYVGGNSIVGTAGITNQLYNVNAGCVLGAGNGRSGYTYSGAVKNSHVVIDGNAKIYNNVYGAGNYGMVESEGGSSSGGGNTSVTIDTNSKYAISTGETSGNAISNNSGTNIGNSSFANLTTLTENSQWVFEPGNNGGYYIKNLATGNYLCMTISASGGGWYPTINRNIYLSSTNKTEFTIESSGGAVLIYTSYTYWWTTYESYLCYKNNTWTYNNSSSANQGTNLYLIEIKESVPDEPSSDDFEEAEAIIDILNGTVDHDVYGGGNQNGVNGNITINMSNGIINGTLYGGANTSGTIKGSSQIAITGGIIGSAASVNNDVIFGGGKGNGTNISKDVKLRILDENNNIIINGNTYGGSALGNITGNTKIIVKDTLNTNGEQDDKSITTIANIYGGGRGSLGQNPKATSNGNIELTIDGGFYSNSKVFGGYNLDGTIGGNVTVDIGKNVKTVVDEVYGGGNQATISSVTDSVIVNLYKNSIVTNAFNGGNEAGIDSSNTTREINSIGATILEGLYGGSNKSGVLTETHVNVSENSNIATVTEKTITNADGTSENIQVIASVYGGGYGTDTSINGNTDVNITNSNIGEVYGGSNSGIVTGNTNVYIEPTEYNVDGSNEIKLGEINITNVYGGGKGDNTTTTGTSLPGQVDGDTSVKILSDKYVDITTLEKQFGTKNIIENVYGGGKGKSALVKGNTNVSINTQTKDKTLTTYNIVDTTDFITTNIDYVYGGGDAGEVSGATVVTILDEKDIEKANNQKEYVTDPEKITSSTNITYEVYGGGNQAKTNSTSVILENVKTKDVYGGGNEGEVQTSTAVSIFGSYILDSVYGGGNKGEVIGNTEVTISNDKYFISNPTSLKNNPNITNSVYGGGKSANVNGTTVNFQENSETTNVYGGGDQGAVIQNTNVKIDNSIVKEAVYGGGKSANVNGTTVNFQENSETTNIYGGGDQGEVIQDTNVIIENSTIKESVYGGGNGADTANDGKTPGKVGGNTNVKISATEESINNDIYATANSVFGGGKGITAFVNTNTNVILEKGTQIENDVYGGGDNGYVNGSTNVELKSPMVKGSVYAAGNGEKAVVYTDSHIYSEGTTQIDKNLYGGGNAAETGKTGDKTSKAIVDIAGLQIKGHVFGGANLSCINGDTIINIGIEAIDEYYGTAKGYIQGTIDIAGTIYGGGYSMNENSDKWDDTAISVTNTITINIFGDNYDTVLGTGEKFDLNITGSIFGSGNASNAAQDGNLHIKNWGIEKTEDDGTKQINRKKIESIQRCTTVTIEKSVLVIYGVKDSTSDYKETLFTFNKIADLQLKDGSTLYLVNGTNRLSSFNSLNADGSYATVDIADDFKTTPSSDNRIYVANGINFNICYGDPQKFEVGPVKGMTFFGIYKSTTNTSDTDPDGIYKGMFDQNYEIGKQIGSYTERDFMRSYAYGKHTKNPEQDITKDGFYTNMEALDEGYTYENISPSNFSAKSYTAYIEPTPRGDYEYYYWFAGPDQETYIYDIELVASKFSTLGSVEVPFSDMNFPGATLQMIEIDSSGLSSRVELVNKSEIKNINNDGDANTKFGLAMKTGNSGWSNRGSAELYRNTYVGDKIYKFENAENSPSMSFYLYHSNNITEDNNFGIYKVKMNLTYWKPDGLNSGTASVYFNIKIMTKKYEGLGYNTAITPGTQYDLFAGSQTNITTKSSFSVFFEMGEDDFFNSLDKVVQESGITLPTDYYNNSYRVISTGQYVLPENATITMIDRYDTANPEYYYYTISNADQTSGKTLFKLDEFLAMGSTDKKYNEAQMRKKYCINNYQYENFIFIVNLEGADYSGYANGSKITPDKNYFEMFLRVDYTVNDENATFDLAKIINDQKDTTGYNIYKAESSIGINATISKNKIYLGNDVDLNVKTIYNAQIPDTRVFDTRYFDKKLGIKLTFYHKETDGQYLPVNGGTMLGTYFSIIRGQDNEDEYYPRSDGTTRIKIAELVSNSSSDISFNTEKSTLSPGDYKILIEVFGSADGIYYGVTASDSTTIEMQIINGQYGLKSTLSSDRQAIIDSETGQVADSEGYNSEIQYNTVTNVVDGTTNKEEVLDNKIKFNLEYQSGLNNPYITVSLYRRDYDSKDNVNPSLYDRTYSLVDLKDYVDSNLIDPPQILSSYDENDTEEVEFINSVKKLTNEYEAVSTEKIKTTVSNPNIPVIFNDLEYELKKNLKTGTYKVVFKLYDTTDGIETRKIRNDDGEIINTQDYDVRIYEEVGDAFSYIIIK